MARKASTAKSPSPAAAALDAEDVRARCDAVLGEDLYWFPVRHHSPAVARHLEAAILARRPRLVFIEGPHEANALLPHLTDARTRPPVAIYSSYRDDDNVLGLAGIASPAEHIPARFSCWYPLLAYSPEYVALQAASKVGAAAVFMDLPHHALIRPAVPVPAPNQPAPPTPAAAPAPRKTPEDDSDRLVVESGFYQRLAAAAGYRSWDEAWDSLFEVRAFDGHDSFRREMAAFCCAVRATTPPERLNNDGTRARERFMFRTIRDTLRERKVQPKDALVVCGGFHLFLDRADKEEPPEQPDGTVYVTLVPYSFFRISELSGYAAGNRAPQFYQRLWDLDRAGRPGDLLIEHVIAVLEQARRGGEPLSSADAIAVCQHADLLARLRGRPVPVLDDVHDALVTCCCKGDPRQEGVHLRKAIDAANIGNKLGKVSPDVGRLPVVTDFYGQMDALGLGDLLSQEKRLNLDLDRREELANNRAIFLHRLRFLQIPVGELADAPSGDFATGRLFREKWALCWNPQIEPALIEQSLYGDTVESAALARLRERLAEDEQHAGRATERLVDALAMDLPNMVHEVEEACGRAIDNDTRFVSLAQALAGLLMIDRHAAYRNLRRDLLADLCVRCFDRACFSILDVVAAPEEQQAEVVSALLSLAEAALRGDRQGLDRGLFAEHVRKAAGLTEVPFLRGVFLGMLTELREWTTEELAAEVSALARAAPERMVTAGDFLDGVLAVSRTSIMLGADALVRALDELLRAAEWEAFLTMLPRLRAAIERLHGSQRDSLAARVAVHYGLTETESLTELRTSVDAAARLARIDRRVAEIMTKWGI
jgi:hypothetical protein